MSRVVRAVGELSRCCLGPGVRNSGPAYRRCVGQAQTRSRGAEGQQRSPCTPVLPVTLHAASRWEGAAGSSDTFSVTLASRKAVPHPRVVSRVPHSCHTMWQAQYSHLPGQRLAPGTLHPSQLEPLNLLWLLPCPSPGPASCLVLAHSTLCPAPPSPPQVLPLSPGPHGLLLSPPPTPIATTVLARILKHGMCSLKLPLKN